LKAISKVFDRIFALEFYRTNAGFFFIAIGLCFGFLSGREHKALAESFVSSPLLLLIPSGLWLLYTFKVIGFNNQSLSKYENSFLFSSASLPKIVLLSCLARVVIFQLAPILAYGIFLIITAIPSGQPLSIVQICLTLFLLLSLVIGKLSYSLFHPYREKIIHPLKRKLDNWLVKPSFWFYPEWIIRQQPLLIIGTKLFACFLLVGVCRLYQFDEYDGRLLAMGCTLTFTSNLVIIFYYHRFENFHFQLLRSLPFSMAQRMLTFLFVIILLNLPEWGVLLNHFPEQLPFTDLFLLCVYGLSIYLFSYSLLFIGDISMEKFINKAFVAAFVLVIVVLFKIPIALITIVQVALALLIYKRNFYRFEFREEVGSEK
jgi:hypothetical protein